MFASIIPLIIGNWKMNGLAENLEQIEVLNKAVGEIDDVKCKVVICPPATLLRPACRAGGDNVMFGGQNCHANVSGAHTGDISAEMLADAGATYVIVGHSERRADCFETNQTVKAKAEAAFRANIIPIICIGETEAERKSGKALEIVLEQLENSLPLDISNNEIIVAYEPVWAIGTGLVPSIADIDEMHSALRNALSARFGEQGANTAILYGGSMKASNAAKILEITDVNGGLVGGASLKASDFIGIISAVK